jgi:hypothetical protein
MEAHPLTFPLGVRVRPLRFLECTVSGLDQLLCQRPTRIMLAVG